MDFGRIDGFVSTETSVKDYSEKTGLEYQIAEERLMPTNIVMFFPNTDEGKALRDEVNVYIQELLDDGTIGELCEKYFGNDMTQFITEKAE